MTGEKKTAEADEMSKNAGAEVAPASSDKTRDDDEAVADAVLRVRQGLEPVEFEWGGERWEGRALSLDDEREITVEYRRAISDFAKENGISTGDRRPGEPHISEYASITGGTFMEMRLKRAITLGPDWWAEHLNGQKQLSFSDLARLYQIWQEAVEGPFRCARDRVLASRGGAEGKPDA